MKRRTLGFTLIELLVVMGIIVILIAVTTLGFGAVARSSRLAAATNQTKAALGVARAEAMHTAKLHAAVFHEGRLVIVKAGDIEYPMQINTLDEFGQPIVLNTTMRQGLVVREFDLPDMTMLAAPNYAANQDDQWTSTDGIGAMFAPDGSIVTEAMWIDDDADGVVDPAESRVMASPLLAVYDERHRQNVEMPLSPFVAEFSDRLVINRYTGLVMR